MMIQIAEMQKKFYDEHKEELEMIENTGTFSRQLETCFFVFFFTDRVFL